MAPICLLLSCKNRVGILKEASDLIASLGYSISSSPSDEGRFTDRYFLRLDFGPVPGTVTTPVELEAGVRKLVTHMDDAYYRINYAEQRKKVIILAGKTTHCLDELLYRSDRNNKADLNMDIVKVISNHETARESCKRYGIPFVYLPATKEDPKEKELLKLIEGSDFLITARYMLKLSGNFIRMYNKAIINIHHGILPGTEGQANPYKKAYERGALTVGATAHFMTEEVDEGPLIHASERDVTHNKTLEEFELTGSSAEREALVEAVKLYLANKVDHNMVDGKRVVFL